MCVCVCESLGASGNIQTASTRSERSVTRLWTGLYGESGQCAEISMMGVTAILALGAIKGPLVLSVYAWGVLGKPLSYLCLQECESIASE
jgi:hypothetical protein